MDFFANKIETETNYYKLQPGENRIRILSRPIEGWVDWVNNKPIRVKFDQKMTANNPAKQPEFFVAMMIWDYSRDKIQIWEIKQKSIMKPIDNLCKDPEWGYPWNYDIKIFRKGNGMETKYTITPVAPKPMDPKIRSTYASIYCRLESLYDGEDPWMDDGLSKTKIEEQGPAQPVNILEQPKIESISIENAEVLYRLFERVPEEKQKIITTGLLNMKIAAFEELPQHLFEKTKARMESFIPQEEELPF